MSATTSIHLASSSADVMLFLLRPCGCFWSKMKVAGEAPQVLSEALSISTGDVWLSGNNVPLSGPGGWLVAILGDGLAQVRADSGDGTDEVVAAYIESSIRSHIS